MWGQVTGNQYLSQMFLKVGNKVITQGGKFVEKKFNTLIFTVDGDRFPKIFSSFPSGGQLFRIISSSPNTVEINWGDGNVINYDFIPSGGEYTFDLRKESAYIFEDGNTGFRDIVMTFKETKGIYQIQTLRSFLGETFPTNILAFTDLETIKLSQGVGVKNFPTKLSPLTKLTVFELFNAEIDILPTSLLSLPIERLILINAIDLDRPFNETNFDKLNLLQNSLKTLVLNRNVIKQIPSSFSELYLLEILDIDFSTVYTLGPEIYNLQSLRLLRINGGSSGYLADFENFDKLTKLESFTSYTRFSAENMGVDVTNFGGLIYIKNIAVYGIVMDSQTKVDTFINTLYNIIEAGAEKDNTIGGSGPFREMSIRCTRQSGTTSPTGIFQEPTGYIQNSNNGSPATPKEKIWVIVNQYNSTVNYSE